MRDQCQNGDEIASDTVSACESGDDYDKGDGDTNVDSDAMAEQTFRVAYHSGFWSMEKIFSDFRCCCVPISAKRLRSK